jgi:hypothetical protein
MSLAWSTVLLLVILLPGFFFLGGLTVPERFNRETPPINTLGQLAVVVFSAFLVHGVLYSTFFACTESPACIRLEYVFAAFQLSDTGAITLADLASNLRENSHRVFGYIVLASSFGGLLGVWVGEAQTNNRRPFRWLNRHNWIYQLNPDPNGGKVAIGYLVTDIEHEQRRLMYQGRLIDFGVGQDGRFTYLVLQSPTRRYLELEGDRVSVSPPLAFSLTERVDNIGLATSSEGFLVIEAGKIRNFYFRPYRAALLDGADAVRRALDAEGPAPESIANSPEMLEPSQPAIKGRPARSRQEPRTLEFRQQKWIGWLGEWSRWTVAALVIQSFGQILLKIVEVEASPVIKRYAGFAIFVFVLSIQALAKHRREPLWQRVLQAIGIALLVVLALVISAQLS